MNAQLLIALACASIFALYPMEPNARKKSDQFTIAAAAPSTRAPIIMIPYQPIEISWIRLPSDGIRPIVRANETEFGRLMKDNPARALDLVPRINDGHELNRAITTGNLAVIDAIAARRPSLLNAPCTCNRSSNAPSSRLVWYPLLYAITGGTLTDEHEILKVVKKLIVLGANLSVNLKMYGQHRAPEGSKELARRCGHTHVASCIKNHEQLMTAARDDNLIEAHRLMALGLYPNPVIGGKRLLDQVDKNTDTFALLAQKLRDWKPESH